MLRATGRRRALALTLISVLLWGCDRDAAPTATVDNAAGSADDAVKQEVKAGHVSGKVVTVDGKPVSDVDVEISGTNVAGGFSEFKLKTDASGAYALKVPNGTYKVAARLTRKLGEFHYLCELVPAGVEQPSFDSTPGAVRNFVWRIDGLRPGAAASPGETRSYLGGSIQLKQGDPNSHADETFKFPAGSKVEMTLKPDGQLLDGSEGKPLSHSFTLDTEIRFTHYSKRTWLDIPIGKYTASATLTEPGGAPKPLRVAMRYYNGPKVPLGSSATVVFPTSDTGFGLTPYVGTADVHVMP